ncbi:MAG: glutamate/aspartate transport system permease protein [Candidatus Tokpelaia sp. JSC161]|jgi:glutamate/aspartate transport system permease protein|nr:MAG: glutamate/aspartate transport system permease protein [Candidatus Tokpelaia sp. JSC161]
MTLDFTFLCKDPADFYGPPLPHCFGSSAQGTVTYLQELILAFKTTTLLTISALILAIITGFLVGIIRTLPKNRFLQILAAFWIEFFRNIPLLIIVFLSYFVVPKIFPKINDLLRQDPFLGSYIFIAALGFFTSARIAEQVRSGINTIPKNQIYAAQALGFTTFQIYLYIFIPHTLRTIMPPLTSEAMGIVKNSAIAISVSVNEMMNFLNQSVEETARSYEIYIIITFLYALLAFFVFITMSFIQYIIYKNYPK